MHVRLFDECHASRGGAGAHVGAASDGDGGAVDGAVSAVKVAGGACLERVLRSAVLSNVNGQAANECDRGAGSLLCTNKVRTAEPSRRELR